MSSRPEFKKNVQGDFHSCEYWRALRARRLDHVSGTLRWWSTNCLGIAFCCFGRVASEFLRIRAVDTRCNVLRIQDRR
jgi:hypothetical protein